MKNNEGENRWCYRLFLSPSAFVTFVNWLVYVIPTTTRSCINDLASINNSSMKNRDTWERCKEANETIQSSQDYIPLHSGGNPTCVSTSPTRHHDLNQHNTQPPQPVQTQLETSYKGANFFTCKTTSEEPQRQSRRNSPPSHCRRDVSTEKENVLAANKVDNTLLCILMVDKYDTVTLIKSLWEGRCYIFAGVRCLKHLLTGIIACSRKPFLTILETLFMNLYN